MLLHMFCGIVCWLAKGLPSLKLKQFAWRGMLWEANCVQLLHCRLR